MPLERMICCCGASTWTKVIAWLQIVGCAIQIGLYTWGVAALASIPSDRSPNKNVGIAVAAILLVQGIVGFIMGIILLNGTNQKRISFLRAWLIYAGFVIVISIVTMVLRISNSNGISYGETLGFFIVGLAITAFCYVVVFVHMREIREGAF